MPAISDQDSLAWIGAPLLPQQRRDWRDKIGGYWKWSEALPGGPPVLRQSRDPSHTVSWTVPARLQDESLIVVRYLAKALQGRACCLAAQNALASCSLGLTRIVGDLKVVHVSELAGHQSDQAEGKAGLC